MSTLATTETQDSRLTFLFPGLSRHLRLRRPPPPLPPSSLRARARAGARGGGPLSHVRRGGPAAAGPPRRHLLLRSFLRSFLAMSSSLCESCGNAACPLAMQSRRAAELAALGPNFAWLNEWGNWANMVEAEEADAWK